MPNNLGKLTNLRTLAIGHKLVKAIPEPVLQADRAGGAGHHLLQAAAAAQQPRGHAPAALLESAGQPLAAGGFLCPLQCFLVSHGVCMLWLQREATTLAVKRLC